MVFSYEAINSEGQTLIGEIEALNEIEVIRALQSRNLQTISVKKAEKKGFFSKSSKSTEKDVLLSLHEMATLLESGVSVAEVIDAQANSDYPKELSDSYNELAFNIRKGASFSIAFKEASFKVPDYMHVLSEAGELSGSLGRSLSEGVKQFEFELKMKRELKSALLYPAILVVFGLAAILFVFIFVVPRFAPLLKNNTDLPLLSELVLSIGLFVAQNAVFVSSVTIFCMLAGAILWRQSQVRAFFFAALEHLPIIGVWLTERDVASWSSLMAALLSSKCELIKALELSARSMSSIARRERMALVIKDVRSGKSLADSLEKNRVLTPAGYNLVRSGEKTGRVDFMIRSLANLYSEGVKKRMEDVLAIVEPLAILFIGGVIGTVMLGIILAMTSVSDVF